MGGRVVIHPDLFRQFNECVWNFRPGELKVGKPVRGLNTTTRNLIPHSSPPLEGLGVGSDNPLARIPAPERI